jgi:hypothetical protein
LRTKEEINNFIKELEQNIEYIRNNKDNWKDEKVPIEMIREKMYRIHTLEWVLGDHDRYD